MDEKLTTTFGIEIEFSNLIKRNLTFYKKMQEKKT